LDCLIAPLPLGNPENPVVGVGLNTDPVHPDQRVGQLAVVVYSSSIPPYLLTTIEIHPEQMHRTGIGFNGALNRFDFQSE